MMSKNKQFRENRLMARKNWLGSGSVLAAATVLAAFSTAEHAHARPGIAGPTVNAIASDRLLGHQMRRGIAPQETRGDTLSVPRIPQRLPDSGTILPTARANAAAPNVQQQVVITAAPVTPSVRANQAQPLQLSALGTQSVAAVIAAPGIAGINVQANAIFDDAQIDFNPSAAIDTVNVLSSAAIIDWTTFTAGAMGTEVTFLGAGDNLDFTSSLGDYTVLNRIFTPGFDSAARIDGNVTSSIFGGAVTGGNIWFYSPGGLIIGSAANFNIGSLLLTTSAPDPTDVGGSFDVNFTGTPDSDSFIRIDSGASINANNTGSYIALVAPRIEQNGTVRANGSIAYVAAEQATLTIDRGLFDISVDVGSGHSSGVGIVHGETASTTGPAQTSVTDEQGIYFVAVPKNKTISMLVGGTIGYDAAAFASEVDGKIVLTTGNRVDVGSRGVNVGGSGVNVGTIVVDETTDNMGAGDISLVGATLTSEIEIFAEGSLSLRDVMVDQTGRVIDLDLSVGDSLTLEVGEDETIGVSGDLNITVGNGTTQGGSVIINVAGTPATGGGGSGPVAIGGSGGLLVDGDVNIDTSANGLDDFFTFRNNGNTGIGQDAVAGAVSISVIDEGVIQVGGDFNIDASAHGGKGQQQNGSATAGSIDLNLASGEIVVAGSVLLSTEARSAQTGKVGGSGPGRIGSDSVAGDVTVNLTGGALDIGDLSVLASADASAGTADTVIQSNDATAANFDLNISGGQHSTGSIEVDVSVNDRESFNGTALSVPGVVTRGSANIVITNLDSGLDVDGDVSIDASVGGAAAGPVGNAITISAMDTGSNTGAGLEIFGDLELIANYELGSDGIVNKAGRVSVTAVDGTISAGSLLIQAEASGPRFLGSTGLRGADFEGGDVSLIANNGGVIDIDGQGSVSANAIAAPSLNSTDIAIGQAGTINLIADDGTIRFSDDLDLSANGFALAEVNANGVTGEGQGGTIRLTVDGADGGIDLVDLFALTTGGAIFDLEIGFFEDSANGSLGAGGTIEINVLDGALIGQGIVLSSSGLGGVGGGLANNAGTAGDGGVGTGGTVSFNLNGGAASFSNLTVSTNGVGGSGGSGDSFNLADGGTGGVGIGGTAVFNGASGSLTVTDTLIVEATGNTQGSRGSGGFGSGAAGGDGGDSSGGNASFLLDGTATITASQVDVSTQSFGGRGGSSRAAFGGATDMGGGQGGDATGGTALFSDIAGNLSFANLTVNSSGQGGDAGDSRGRTTGTATGDGGDGGLGTGGAAVISLNQDDAAAKSYTLVSQGIGGFGGSGASGGTGGDGVGGTAEISVNDVAVAFNQLTVNTMATGGGAGFIDGEAASVGANGGNAIGGTSTVMVNGSNADFTANSLVSIQSGAVGADGSSGSASFIPDVGGGAGGSGGNALGGTVQIVFSNGANFFLDADSIVFNADANGGNGGSGGSSFVSAIQLGGGGGGGGGGTGGTVAIVANTGSNVTLVSTSVPFNISSNGTGGDGGDSGNSNSGLNTGVSGLGGGGTGGSPTFSATGATITGNEVEVFAIGQSGDFGAGEIEGSGFQGPNGFGFGAGGTPIIEVVEGSPGIITLGQVTITATGERSIDAGDEVSRFGGQVTIRDLSTDPLGLITLGGLNVDATGDPESASGNLTFDSASGPITIDGNLTATVTGEVDFNLFGDGMVAVSGATNLAASGNINVQHSGNGAGNASILTGTTFTATSVSGGFFADATSVIDTTQDVNITAETITYGDITSTRVVNLTAIGGSIMGSSTGTITASSIVDAINLLADGEVTFGTLTTVAGNVDIDAGETITGTRVNSTQFVNMDAGGLITVENVQATGVLSLVVINGGSADLGTLNANNSVNVTTTIGDLAIDDLDTPRQVNLVSAADINLGVADTNNFVANAQGDIDVGELVTTGNVANVSITSAAEASYTSIDGDALVTINAVEIVGGDLVADGQATLTGESLNIGDVTSEGSFVVLTSNSDDIITGDLTSTILGVIVDSSAAVNIGNVSSVGTTRLVSVTDLAVGDVDAGNALEINSGGNLDAGALSADAFSPGLTITVDGNADIDSTQTNGLFNANVTGALTGGNLTSNSLVTINAGSLDVDLVGSNTQSVAVTTLGALSVGAANSAVNTVLTGTTVNIDAGNVGGNLTVTTSVGDITGNGDIVVGGLADLDSAADIVIGTLEANSILMEAAGDILFNGLISPNAVELTAAAGTIGTNTAGLGDIETDDDVDLAALVIDLGDVTSGGNITAAAAGGDANFGDIDVVGNVLLQAIGRPSVESLRAGGDASLLGADVVLSGGDIGGNLGITANTGDVTLALDGADQILVGGVTQIGAIGDIIITHSNNAADTISLDSTGQIGMLSLGNFVAGTGSIISSDAVVAIRSEGDLSINDVRGVAIVDLSAGGNATVNDATLTGGTTNLGAGSIVTGGIIISAGSDNGTSIEFFDPTAMALVTGDVTSDGSILVEAGGNAVFQAGSSTVSQNGISVVTGDDIIIEGGALVEIAANPVSTPDLADPFAGNANLSLSAGFLDAVGQLTGQSVSPISSIVIGGTIETNDFAAILNGNAIDGLGGTINANSLSADVTDAPNAGPMQSDDATLLTTACLEGNICLGNVNVDNQLLIGSSSNNGVISLTIEQGTINADTVSLTTREGLTLGTIDASMIFNTANNFTISSIEGNVNLFDATVNAGQIRIEAADSLVGTGELNSASDIGITVGNSLSAGSIITDGELTQTDAIGGPIEGEYSAQGDFIVGTLSFGSTDIDIVSEGNIDIGEAISPDDVFLMAGGTARLGFADVTGNIEVVGTTIAFDNLVADGSILLEANDGSIIEQGMPSLSAGVNLDLIATENIDVGGLSAIGIITLDAGDAVRTAAINAGTSATVDGTTLDLGVVETGTSFSAQGNEITFNSLDTGGPTSLIAATGSITGMGPGTIDGDDFVSLSAENGSVTTAEINTGRIQITANGGDVATGDITTTNGSVGIFTMGAVNVGGVDSAGGISISGASFDGSTVLNRAALGALISTGIGGARFDTIVSEGTANLASDGDVTFTSGIAASDFAVRGDGDVSFVSAEVGGNGLFVGRSDGSFIAQSITVASTDIFPSTIDAGTDLTLGTISANNADLTAGGALRVTDNAIISSVLVVEGSSVDVIASDDLTFRATATNGDINVTTGGAMDVRGADATGNIRLESTGGGIAANDIFTRPVFSTLPSGTQGLQQITATGGDITIIAAGDFTVTNAVSAANNLLIDIGGTITLDALTTGLIIDAVAGDIAITANGQLGEADGTSQIDILSLNDATLGGAGGSGQFEIDNDEFSRIFSNGDIAITAGQNTGTVLTVDTLDIAVGASANPTDGNIGSGGALFLGASGNVDVIGNVAMTNAAIDNFIGIDAGDQINIDFDNGNIRIEDAGGAPTGEIDFTAFAISAISSAAATDIANGTVADIDTRLAINDGTVRDEGFIQAADVTFNVGDSLLIQNTGAGTDFDDRRGITAQSLVINNDNAAGGNIAIVVNGVVGPLTGIDALNATAVTGAFDPASTINGCVINDPTSCVVAINPPNPGPIIPTPGNPSLQVPDDQSRDVIEEGLDPDEDIGVGAIQINVLDFSPTAEFGVEPLIDEPVTGAGNDDLWVDPECPPGAEAELCAAQSAE